MSNLPPERITRLIRLVIQGWTFSVHSENFVSQGVLLNLVATLLLLFFTVDRRGTLYTAKVLSAQQIN